MAFTFGKKKSPHLKGKIQKSVETYEQAYSQYAPESMVMAWTGGKDSTLLLWLLREYISKSSKKYPSFVFINEGDLFEEVVDFAEKLSKDWKFSFSVIQNDDVLSQNKKLGEKILVKDLSEYNQKEIKRLGYDKDSFPFEPESLVGNHLMKTVPMQMYIEKHNVEAVITGIRWDEQEARAQEDYFSPRKNPDHMRIHPILHFSEQDVWDTTHEYGIPYVGLYDKGYRSLGAKSTTGKTSDKPAWEQDLKNTTEREGRAQDKEKMMQRLRDLGYM